jgi:pimeloyl-ACP methyl ester carboxylesterase
MSALLSDIATPLMSVSTARLGAGTPILYLHDVLFDLVDAEGEVPAIIDLLSTSHTVYAPALPGFRDLKELAGFERVDDYVLLVSDLILALGLDRPHVVGTGFGGWIAAELAALVPESIATLTLINAFGLRVEGHPTARFFDAAAPNPLGGRREARELLFANPMDATAMQWMPDHPDDKVNERFFVHVHAAARIGWAPPAFYDPRLLGRLSRIRVPAHVVWGADNRLVDVAHAQAYESGIGNAALTVIGGAGHAITVEQPAELAQSVASFIAQHRV